MRIQVNGKAREVPGELTVTALLTALGCAPEGVAVAVNGAVVPRGQHPSHAIREGDRVEILQAVGGG